MENKKRVLGYAMCGSFCTLSRAVSELCELADEFDVLPIMSEITYVTDTRFGRAQDFINQIAEVCGRDIVHTIKGAEPIGPKNLTDIMVIAPCTGNTLAKLALGITDSTVTMAAKAHLRNDKPLVIALATNDALSNSAKNIGALMNIKNVYFVPFSQDEPDTKERSCIADFSLIPKTIKLALEGKQIQPIITLR